MVSSRTSLLFMILTCGAAAMTGCADPEGEFNDFTERTQKIGSITTTTTTTTGDCQVPEVGAVDGDYLLTLSAKLNAKQPIMFLAHLTTAAMGEGLGFSMNLQPLAATDRKTPVGDAADVGPFQIEADGAFTADMPPLSVTGEANPITGSDIQADATLIGTFCAPAESLCGDVTGQAIASITVALDGSTFTLQKIADPASYPEAVINCAGDVADPPPAP